VLGRLILNILVVKEDVKRRDGSRIEEIIDGNGPTKSDKKRNRDRTSKMISQHRLESDISLSNIRIPGQSINFVVPSSHFWNSFKNHPPIFGARRSRIPSSFPVMFPEYSHARISRAFANELDRHANRYTLFKTQPIWKFSIFKYVN
jgi:hypothetical protein